MIDDISFEIAGNQPTFFINCENQQMDMGYSPLDLPVVFFLSNEMWFHNHVIDE